MNDEVAASILGNAGNLNDAMVLICCEINEFGNERISKRTGNFVLMDFQFKVDVSVKF